MSLPAAWVDRIFERLTLVYGHQFLGRWSGLDLNAVKDDWGRELAGLERNAAAIGYALENLPAGDPPNVLQFRAICNRRPAETPRLLPPDKDGLKRIAGALTVLGGPKETPAEWMARLDRDVAAGTASRARIEHHRIATANGYYGNTAGAVAGSFIAPAADSLPMSMRDPQAICSRCGQTGHRDHNCPWPLEAEQEVQFSDPIAQEVC